jgi:hypothetical protein
LIPVIEIVVSLAALAVLVLVMYVRWLGNRRPSEQARRSGKPAFNTTLGEFHEMREALRPLEHTRAASRRVPKGGR